MTVLHYHEWLQEKFVWRVRNIAKHGTASCVTRRASGL